MIQNAASRTHSTAAMTPPTMEPVMTFFLEKLVLLDPADCPVPVLETLSGEIAVVAGSVCPASPPGVPDEEWVAEPRATSKVEDPKPDPKPVCGVETD